MEGLGYFCIPKTHNCKHLIMPNSAHLLHTDRLNWLTFRQLYAVESDSNKMPYKPFPGYHGFHDAIEAYLS